MGFPHSKAKSRRPCPVCRRPVLHLVGDGCCQRCWRARWVLEDGFWTRRVRLDEADYYPGDSEEPEA